MIHSMYTYKCIHVNIRMRTCPLYMYTWLSLPSNQPFCRLIECFGMDVDDCEVGQYLQVQKINEWRCRDEMHHAKNRGNKESPL